MFIPQHLKVLDTTKAQLISCGSINNIQLGTLLDKLQNEIGISIFEGVLNFVGDCNSLRTNVIYSTGSSFFINPEIVSTTSITSATQFVCNTFPSTYPLIMYNTNAANTFWRLGRDASNFGYMKYDSTANTITLEISGGNTGMVVSANDTKIASALTLGSTASKVYPTFPFTANLTPTIDYIKFDNQNATDIRVIISNAYISIPSTNVDKYYMCFLVGTTSGSSVTWNTTSSNYSGCVGGFIYPPNNVPATPVQVTPIGVTSRGFPISPIPTQNLDIDLTSPLIYNADIHLIKHQINADNSTVWSFTVKTTSSRFLDDSQSLHRETQLAFGSGFITMPTSTSRLTAFKLQLDQVVTTTISGSLTVYTD